MNTYSRSKNAMLIVGRTLFILVLFSTPATAQEGTIPDNLLAREIAPEISHSIKSALDISGMPCGMEGAHEQHDHIEPVRIALLQRESAMTVDSARKLIFSPGELSAHQLLVLVNTLGELQPSDTDSLLRSVYQYADIIGKRYLVDDIEDEEMQRSVLNSNIDDIRAAVIGAVSKNNSKQLIDLVKQSAKGQGYPAQKANSLLKQQTR